MTYFHPRDFGSKSTCNEGLSLFRKFKTYVGLKNAFKKFEKLISDFNFIDIKEANKKINWEDKDIIKF